MPPVIAQHAGNTTASDSSSCRVTLDRATQQGSHLTVIATARIPRGHNNPFPSDPAGFSGFRVALGSQSLRDDIAIAVWEKPNATPISSVTVQAVHESLQVRVLETRGLAQAAALDRVAILGGEPSTVSTGATGAIAQADELLIGAIVNQNASTTQGSFTGGLAKLSDTTSPSSDLDGERHRLTVHAAITNTVGSYQLGGRLSTPRDWIGVLLSFRGGTLGPLKMTSLSAPPLMTFGGRGALTVFGRFSSLNASPVMTFSGSGWIGPANHQLLLGGRGANGLMIGAGTDYRIESLEGLGGWDVESSDTPFPRFDGDQRGVDRQNARSILGRVNWDGPPVELEQAAQRLLMALRPRRSEDFDLYFRLPGMPLRTIRCRPGSLIREMTAEQMILTKQAFLLRAADPRIYSARAREVLVPASPSTGTVVTAVSAINAGNAQAFPVIRVTGAPDVDVTGLELVNITGNCSFEMAGVLPAGAQLVADMPAEVTAQPRSTITIGGQSKLGAWVPPREPFFLSPAPDAVGGVNALYLRTTPAGAAVTCALEYRDTWAG